MTRLLEALYNMWRHQLPSYEPEVVEQPKKSIEDIMRSSYNFPASKYKCEVIGMDGYCPHDCETCEGYDDTKAQEGKI